MEKTLADNINAVWTPEFGGFDAFPWYVKAKAIAAHVAARRGFADAALFGRPLEGYALRAATLHSEAVASRQRQGIPEA